MKFSLKNIELSLFLGVFPAEQSTRQTVLVSVAYELDVSQAKISDQLEDSVDYQALYDLVQSFSQRPPVKLLEKLHETLKTEILSKFPAIKKLKLKICKFPFASGKVCVESSF